MEIIEIKQGAYEKLSAIGRLLTKKADTISDLGVWRNYFYNACVEAEISRELGLEIVNDARPL